MVALEDGYPVGIWASWLSAISLLPTGVLGSARDRTGGLFEPD